MSLYTKITMAVVMILTALTASAQRRFENIANKEGFNYSYISPTMLKAMGSCTFNSNGYTLNTSGLNCIETVSTMTEGTDSALWDAIRSVIKSEGLETLTTNKTLNSRFDMLGKLSGSTQITRLMLIQQNSGDWISVTYIEGSIPITQLQGNF